VSLGTGFATFNLPPPLNTIVLGICMDLNVQPPKSWDTLDGPYEIADYCLSQQADVLVLLNAWLESFEDDQNDHAWGTLNFWAQRLRPLWVGNGQTDVEGDSPSTDEGANDSATRPHTDVIICNRTGEENGMHCLTSALIF